MQDTAGEVRTTFSNGSVHTDVQMLDNQLEYIYNTDSGCSQEYLPEAMDDRDKWRERVR